MKKHLIFLVISLLSIYCSYGQGTIRGKITDENGEALIGATIMLKLQRTTGTITDYDGNYSLKISDLSPQPIVISYIGYQSIEDTVNPQKNEVIIRNFEMISASSQIGEVKVIGKAVRAKESYMEQIKMRSAASLDFISAETIKRTGDASVSAAVSRITGVSTFGGFITVRGIGDRYVKSTINGSRIPTLDPFTNNIKLDLFPASLVDNIVVTKTASADLPGDWAGAYLSVETKDYPEKFTVSLETSLGYNSQSTFNEVVSSTRSSTDWMGYDNGLRNIRHQKPAYYDLNYFKYQEFTALGLKDYFNGMGVTENTSWDVNDYTSVYTRLALVQLDFLKKAQFNDNEAIAKAVADYNASDLKQQGLRAATAEVVKMGQSLPNNWLTINRKAPADFSQSFSIGNQTLLLHKPLGYLFGFRYASSTLYDKNASYGRTDFPSNGVTNVDNPYDIYHTYGSSKSSIETNGWSALFNVAYKFNTDNSISFLFMPNLIGVNKARTDFSYSIKTGSGITFYSISQFYESRKQMVYQFKSDHYLPSLKLKIELNASYTKGNSNSPDYKQLNYVVDPNTQAISRLYWTSQESGNFRIFRTLSEDLFDSRLTADLPLGDRKDLTRKIKFGGAYQRLVRKADQRYYILPPRAIDSRIYNNDLAGYLSIDSFAFADGRVKRYYQQLAGPENNTIGFSSNMAGFVIADYAVSRALRITGGIRVEDIHLHTDIVDYYDRQLAVNDDRRLGIKPGIRNQVFYLPSANIIYQLNRDNQAPVNIRFNFSQTMALPSLRELTPFKIYDYTLLGVVTGNANLKPVNINNYDVRLEAYFKSGDNISLSLFYKKFIHHIEMIREEKDEVYYSWQNAENSKVMGIELEGRIGITKSLELRANTTLVDSKTRLKNDTISRAMFGQAPYVINAMLSYTLEKMGLAASISYNVQGPKLVITGTYDRSDIYELPRNIIDIKFTKKLGKYLTASFRIRDLLNTSVRRAYKFPSAGWLDFDKYTYGTTYLLGISYNLN
jgi:TonB-dependent receptor